MAGDVHAGTEHKGRGGWSWYTGAAAWMYRLIVESLLGIRLEAGTLHFRPAIPGSWDAFKVHYRYRESVHHITFRRGNGAVAGVSRVVVDGEVEPGTSLRLRDDGREHEVEVELGLPIPAPSAPRS